MYCDDDSRTHINAGRRWNNSVFRWQGNGKLGSCLSLKSAVRYMDAFDGYPNGVMIPIRPIKVKFKAEGKFYMGADVVLKGFGRDSVK